MSSTRDQTHRGEKGFKAAQRSVSQEFEETGQLKASRRAVGKEGPLPSIQMPQSPTLLLRNVGSGHDMLLKARKRMKRPPDFRLVTLPRDEPPD